jgi:ATP-dependent protease ClpP protease subunit
MAISPLLPVASEALRYQYRRALRQVQVMRWHIFYRVGGNDRDMEMEAAEIPHIKAVAFTVFVHEFPNEPSPCELGADVEAWLAAKGITILDIRLR